MCGWAMAQRRVVIAVLSAAGALACAGTFSVWDSIACAQDATPRETSARAPSEMSDAEHDAALREVQALIGRLDSEQFAERNEATRTLLAKGPASLPVLVTSLGVESREVRFRVAGILRGNFSFDELAPYLLDSLHKKYGNEARLILRDRALGQVAEAAEMDHTKRLFDFWSTDVESLRRLVVVDLMDAPGAVQAAAIVAPLIGLRDKAKHFHEILVRLDDISLPFDHRHSPGYLVAETLAKGLLQNGSGPIEFAHRYVDSLERLSADLADQGLSRGAIRKEIADRTNMSDGAASFLVRLLDQNGQEYQTLTRRLAVSPEGLQDEFFRGLTLPDIKECFRCVGKVHIADMLLEVLQKWPSAPDDGPVRSVIDCVGTTIGTGDKPKALALLDALDGCAQLDACQIGLQTPWGERLSKRLCLAALAAPNSREYHPVRSIHDGILDLAKQGLAPDHESFPHDAAMKFVDGAPVAVDEDARAAWRRYVQTVDLLRSAGQAFEQPGVREFLTVMGKALADRSPLLAEGAAKVRELDDRQKQNGTEPMDPSFDSQLGTWAAQHK